jgi:hypothetical protein
MKRINVRLDLIKERYQSCFMAHSRVDVEALEKALRVAINAISDEKVLREIAKTLRPITRARW